MFTFESRFLAPQFHISGLFPRKRGFISALFVAGFTGCGIIFYVLDRIFEDLGGHRCAFPTSLCPKHMDCMSFLSLSRLMRLCGMLVAIRF